MATDQLFFLMFLHTFLIFVIFFVCVCGGLGLGSSSSSDCASELVWKKLYYVEDTRSVSVQICCNVTGVWAARLLPDWEMEMPPAIDNTAVEQLSFPGFEMVLSRCHNETRIGMVFGRNDCVTEKGKILHLEENGLLQFDQWYIMCFRVNPMTAGSGASSRTYPSPCPTLCSVEKLCTNARRCQNVWIDREIVNASETSISVLVQVGRLPFTAILKTTVVEIPTSSNRSDPKTYVVESMPRVGQLAAEIDGLRPNSWYRIQTCIHIPTPTSFTSPTAAIRLPKESVFCLEDETVRTSKIDYSFNKKTSAARKTSSALNFVLYLTPLLLAFVVSLL